MSFDKFYTSAATSPSKQALPGEFSRLPVSFLFPQVSLAALRFDVSEITQLFLVVSGCTVQCSLKNKRG